MTRIRCFKSWVMGINKKEQAHKTHTYKPPHHSEQRHSFQDSNYHKNDQIPKFQKVGIYKKKQALREGAKYYLAEFFC